ncbi:response regulator [Marinilactibacillus sp. Marseille-P9653]|uniref:response regulator n=1 Tax=Marinilactibacillus sp. Marseille-P9653 TaxID=2866583 RepID=UPI001CE3D5A8|nr:response regulator [Marinilactibacillus sp. Marseille-P9653]
MVYYIGIIEDDPMVSSINKRFVSRVEGFEVAAELSTVKAAEECLIKGKVALDLLLIDIHLNDESGLEFVKWLRANEYSTDFIMVTAMSEEKTISLCAQYGAIDYILKPFRFDRFEKSLIKFKQQAEWLKGKQAITQEDIDHYYWFDHLDYTQDSDSIEKGLSKETLNLLIELIDQFEGSFTIEELTKKSSLSHVSVRKYVRYLEASNILEAHSTYGTVGRPTMSYVKII